jgi:hypothetical protein
VPPHEAMTVLGVGTCGESVVSVLHASSARCGAVAHVSIPRGRATHSHLATCRGVVRRPLKNDCCHRLKRTECFGPPPPIASTSASCRSTHPPALRHRCRPFSSTCGAASSCPLRRVVGPLLANVEPTSARVHITAMRTCVTRLGRTTSAGNACDLADGWRSWNR